MNKKIGMFALAALVLGAGGSIAVQSFAQTNSAVPSTISASKDKSIDQKDQKDQNGNDLETNDDITDVTASRKDSVAEKQRQDMGEQGESTNDADGGVNED